VSPDHPGTPGWGKNDRELDERVDSSVAAFVHGAGASRARLFEVEPVDAFMEQ
jgi:hypothetical protein